jgi:hypothetical protein
MSDLLVRSAFDGDLATTKHLHAEGVDVTECGKHGTTAIIMC